MVDRIRQRGREVVICLAEREAGKEGLTAAGIKAKFPALKTGLKQYFSKYAADATIKTHGDKAQVRYHL